MVQKSPDTVSDEPTTYECMECGERMTAEQQPMECPECGGGVQNIEKPRE